MGIPNSHERSRLNDIWRKYACKRKFVQIIKWLDNAYRVVRETRRQQNKWISQYNVVFFNLYYTTTFTLYLIT